MFVSPVILMAAMMSETPLVAERSEAIVVQQRIGLALIINSPTGELAKLGRTETRVKIGDLLAAYTGLRLISELETEDPRFCRGGFYCLVKLVRPDADPDTKVKDAERHPGDVARFLMLLSNISQTGKPDRVSSMLIDTEIVKTLAKRADRETDEGKLDLETKIFEEAVLGRVDWEELDDTEAVLAYLDRILTRDFRPAFEKLHAWQPFGSIVVSGAPENVEVYVDGNLVGVTRDGDTRIIQVPFGPRELRLDSKDHFPFATEIDISPNATVTVSPGLVVKPSEISEVARDFMFWGGVVTAAAGLALTSYALVERKDAEKYPPRACIGGTSCNFEAGWVPVWGMPAAPVGIGLLGLGSSWIAGPMMSDDSSAVWWSLAGGVAVGALAVLIPLLARPHLADPYE